MVEAGSRGARGRCDKAGFLIDKQGKRIVDSGMKDRIRKRTYASPQSDEFYRIDEDGEKVEGHYDSDGYFIVEMHMRNVPGRCDKNGFLLSKSGQKIADDVIRDRLRVRSQLHSSPDEFEAKN